MIRYNWVCSNYPRLTIRTVTACWINVGHLDKLLRTIIAVLRETEHSRLVPPGVATFTLLFPVKSSTLHRNGGLAVTESNASVVRLLSEASDIRVSFFSHDYEAPEGAQLARRLALPLRQRQQGDSEDGSCEHLSESHHPLTLTAHTWPHDDIAHSCIPQWRDGCSNMRWVICRACEPLISLIH